MLGFVYGHCKAKVSSGLHKWVYFSFYCLVAIFLFLVAFHAWSPSGPPAEYVSFWHSCHMYQDGSFCIRSMSHMPLCAFYYQVKNTTIANQLWDSDYYSGNLVATNKEYFAYAVRGEQICLMLYSASDAELCAYICHLNHPISIDLQQLKPALLPAGHSCG